MSNQKNIVFVYSSDYRKLYKKDIYNVLSFPAGFVMHFRYRLKWVSDELKNNLPLEGNQVIMIAAIINNDDQTNPEYVLMPFRKGRIISTITDGDTLHIYFELLSEWIQYDDSLGKSVDFYDNLMKQGECPSNGKFVVYGKVYNQLLFSTNTSSWVQIIERLVKFNQYKRSIFYRINNFSKLPEGDILKVKELDKLTRGYILKKGKNYSIDISYDFAQDPPEQAKNALFKFDNFENLKIIPRELLLGFRVDKKQFYLSTGGRSFNIRTIITTKVENSIEGPELEIPIKIKKNKSIYAVYLIFIFTGLILLGWPWAADAFGFSMKLTGTGLTTLGTALITYYTRW